VLAAARLSAVLQRPAAVTTVDGVVFGVERSAFTICRLPAIHSSFRRSSGTADV
jgi:hypothetical protein